MYQLILNNIRLLIRADAIVAGNSAVTIRRGDDVVTIDVITPGDIRIIPPAEEIGFNHPPEETMAA